MIVMIEAQRISIRNIQVLSMNRNTMEIELNFELDGRYKETDSFFFLFQR